MKLIAIREAIVDRVERDRDYVISLAQELVRIPSVNPRFEPESGAGYEAEAQRLVARELEAAGFETELYDLAPGRPNVIGRRSGTEERSLIVNGHVDVVPAGDGAEWTSDPFEGALRGSRLYGRGSYDMKAGLAAAIAAARALRDCDVELSGRLEFHSVVDEEVGGFGSIDLVRRGHLASGMISAESTNGRIVVAEGGLEWVRVTLRGRSGHAGHRYADIYPQRAPIEDGAARAVNAAELAARFITAVGGLEKEWGTGKEPHALLAPGVNTISPGVVRVGASLGPDGLPVIMDNPAITPDTAVLDFDLKFLPGEISGEVRRSFENFVRQWASQDTWLRERPPAVRWELGGLHFPPFDTPSDHPLVTALLDGRTAIAGNAELAGFDGVCDAAHYARAGVPCIVYGPTGGGAHASDEWVDVDSLVETAKIYAVAFVGYCGAE